MRQFVVRSGFVKTTPRQAFVVVESAEPMVIYKKISRKDAETQRVKKGIRDKAKGISESLCDSW